ncbi:MAG: NosD domain-containing protein, partial [Candidatus Hodarchaeota archaeon]
DNKIETNEFSKNGIALDLIGTTNSEIISNSVVNNSYGFYLDQGCSRINIMYNDFIGNHYLVQEQNLIESQAFDYGIDNIFVFNHYDDWVSPDDDLDGYVDSPYLINGSAQNNDPYPLVHPNPPFTRRIFGNKVIYPNGGEEVGGAVLVEWTNALDSHKLLITYSVYFSENSGKEWNLLEEFISRTYYTWDTLLLYDGSSYLIKVIAYASDGFSHEDISDGTFIVRNGNLKPLPPPPLLIRILLFVILSVFLTVFIKRNRIKAI